MENIFYDENERQLLISDFSPAYKPLRKEVSNTNHLTQPNNDLVMLGTIAFTLLYGDLVAQNEN